VVTDAAGRIVLTNPVADRLYARPVPYGQDYESHAVFEMAYPNGQLYAPRDLPLTRAALDNERFSNVEMDIHWRE